MYGLVNQGIRDMVIAAGGEALWDQVRHSAGIEHDDFISMQAYDDSVTLSLVAAASEALDTPADKLLHGFGHHWVRYTSQTGYGPLMNASGDSLEGFLANLDQLHARIKMSMPSLDPPSFVCGRRDDGVLELAYYSNREGLVPMVVGLVEGLADKFGEQAEVVHTKAKSSIDEPDLFEVRVNGAAA